MAKKIKAPEWAPNAVIDPKGWRDPATGELLVARKFSDKDIEEYNGEVMLADEGGKIKEAKPESVDLTKLKKVELVELAKEQDILPEGKVTKNELVELLESQEEADSEADE